MAVPNPFDPNRHRETIDRTIKRLQARIADGDEHLRAELAGALMRSAQEFAEKAKFEPAIKRISEGLFIIRQLVNEGQIELDLFVGRALIFQAALLRVHKGAEAGINALNEAIRHLADSSFGSDSQVQNELATALLTKGELLIDPLGAHSAALAAQEQAEKIWQHLVNQGNLEYRPQLIQALICCSDSKVQNGDLENAINDLKNASELAQDGVEDGDPLFQPLFIQTLLKLTRLYDQEGNLADAFGTIQSAIRTVQNLVAGGIDQAQIMFTTLYMHSGMLYEKVRNSEAALADFDRCRDAYIALFRDQHWGDTEAFAFRTGLANTLMCRGNMLADLKRYAEAEHAFEESIWQYQQAEKQLPADDRDVTLIPYSIGVVQLNLANLYAAQDKLKEAVNLKKQALDALQRRMEAGHSEILPNFLTAYRKLIDIRRYQNDVPQMLGLMDNMLHVLENAVDEGKLEYRIDLAITYRQRSALLDDMHNFSSAQADALKALRLFRTIADDDREIPDVHVSKIQWSEILHQIAVLLIKQNEPEKAFEFFQKEVVDAIRFYEEGNEFAAVDLLLAYTKYIEFVETVSSHIGDIAFPFNKFLARLQEVRNHCLNAIKLSEKKQNETGNNLVAKLFFMMKTAFFYKEDGILLRLQNNVQDACLSFLLSIKCWYLLLEGLENLKAKAKYDAAEKGEPIPDWDIPGGTDDPYQDRYVYYINELRETMQQGSTTLLACNKRAEAEQLIEQENSITRGLVQNEIHNADRFLILSLSFHARYFAARNPVKKTLMLYSEAIQIMEERFRSGNVIPEDYWVLHRTCKEFTEFLQSKKQKYLIAASDHFWDSITQMLSSVEVFPSPLLWRALWGVLELPGKTALTTAQILLILKRSRKAYKRHPEYKNNKELKSHDKNIKQELDKVKERLNTENDLGIQ